jgi:hypothetical protein
MIALSRQWVLAAILGAILAVLAAWQASAPVSLDLPILPTWDGAGKPKAPADTVRPTSGSPADYTEVENRPLFVSGRKPPAAAVSPVTTAQSQALNAYSIVGIISAPDRAVAVLHGPNGPAIHLRKGQAVEGWTLETIEKNRLIFVSGDQRQELDVKSNKNQQGQGPLRTNMGMTSQRPGGIPGYPGNPAQ